MLRAFAGATTEAGGRLETALDGEGQAHLIGVGPWRLAYTGEAIPRPGAGEPVCLVDGAVYDAIDRDLPARDGPELEAFLARAYARGELQAIVPCLRGDFILVLLDSTAPRGLIVRDQMGGRSAVWAQTAQGPVFASEYRPLIAALPRRPEPDPVAAAHWIGLSGLPGDRSLYSGVRRLQAGCRLRLDRARSEPARYWAAAPAPHPGRDRSELAERLRAALAGATERRVAPGERAAVMLSGGLDSGAVAAVSTRNAPGRRPAAAYSATFPGHPSVDESSLIAEVAAELGLASTRIDVKGGSVLSGALEYLGRHEVPPVSPNLFFWNPLLKRAAEDGVTVMLDGEGGDELFGLSGFLIADRLRHGRLLGALTLIARIPHWRGRASRAIPFYLRTYGLKGLTPYTVHHAVRRMRGPARYAPAWMRPGAAAALVTSDERHAWKREPGARWRVDLVHRVTRGMGPALAYDHVRRRSALAGVEPRHPLVDVDVIELVLSLPPELAFDRTWTRPLLRESLKGLLPDSVRLRPEKSNFDAIFHDALTGVDLPVVHALLSRADAEVGAYVNLAAVADLIDAPPSGRQARMWWALHVWRLVTAECFLLAQAGPDAIAKRLPSPLTEADYRLSERRPLTARG